MSELTFGVLSQDQVFHFMCELASGDDDRNALAIGSPARGWGYIKWPRTRGLDNAMFVGDDGFAIVEIVLDGGNGEGVGRMLGIRRIERQESVFH